ncbi:hypothetical protein NFI96_030833 [Prochilodus magdalenae]|nr:hypothetical protein NFI96_030833 [Prochilodus magdalenae]
MSFPTRENNILNQVYSNVRGGYKAAAQPHFGRSDHISMFLYPAYRQLLKQAPPVGNAEDYKRARYDLRRSIRQAKRQYRVKLEGCYTSADSWCMWQGLRHITDYQQRSREVTTSHTTLPDELNEFNARFETLNPDRQRGVMAEGSTQNSSLAVTSVEVCKALKRINPQKAAGPDNIPGRALKVCSGMFVDIFNLSLAQSFVPSCFKTTIIVPLPKKSVVT